MVHQVAIAFDLDREAHQLWSFNCAASACRSIVAGLAGACKRFLELGPPFFAWRGPEQQRIAVRRAVVGERRGTSKYGTPNQCRKEKAIHFCQNEFVLVISIAAALKAA